MSIFNPINWLPGRGTQQGSASTTSSASEAQKEVVDPLTLAVVVAASKKDKVSGDEKTVDLIVERLRDYHRAEYVKHTSESEENRKQVLKVIDYFNNLTEDEELQLDYNGVVSKKVLLDTIKTAKPASPQTENVRKQATTASSAVLQSASTSNVDLRIKRKYIAIFNSNKVEARNNLRQMFLAKTDKELEDQSKLFLNFLSRMSDAANNNNNNFSKKEREEYNKIVRYYIDISKRAGNVRGNILRHKDLVKTTEEYLVKKEYLVGTEQQYLQDAVDYDPEKDESGNVFNSIKGKLDLIINNLRRKRDYFKKDSKNMYSKVTSVYEKNDEIVVESGNYTESDITGMLAEKDKYLNLYNEAINDILSEQEKMEEKRLTYLEKQVQVFDVNEDDTPPSAAAGPASTPPRSRPRISPSNVVQQQPPSTEQPTSTTALETPTSLPESVEPFYRIGEKLDNNGNPLPFYLDEILVNTATNKGLVYNFVAGAESAKLDIDRQNVVEGLKLENPNFSVEVVNEKETMAVIVGGVNKDLDDEDYLVQSGPNFEIPKLNTVDWVDSNKRREAYAAMGKNNPSEIIRHLHVRNEKTPYLKATVNGNSFELVPEIPILRLVHTGKFAIYKVHLLSRRKQMKVDLSLSMNFMHEDIGKGNRKKYRSPMPVFVSDLILEHNTFLLFWYSEYEEPLEDEIAEIIGQENIYSDIQIKKISKVTTKDKNFMHINPVDGSFITIKPDNSDGEKGLYNKELKFVSKFFLDQPNDIATNFEKAAESAKSINTSEIKNVEGKYGDEHQDVQLLRKTSKPFISVQGVTSDFEEKVLDV